MNIEIANRLQQLRKEILWKEFDKRKDDDFVLSKVWKEDTIDYLLAEWKDRIKLKRLFKWIILSFSKSLKELKEYSEKLKNCDTINELNNLQGQVINWNNNQNKIQNQQNMSMNEVIAQQNMREHKELDNFNINIAPEYYDTYKQLKIWEQASELPDLIPFSCALKWYNELCPTLWNNKYLTVVDYTKPKSQNRFFVINMSTKTVEHSIRVWHWHNSWEWQYANSFSNVNGSEQSCLGFMTTATQREDNSNPNYHWSGLRMSWTKKDINNNWNAAWRWIFMHRGGENRNNVAKDLFSQWCFVIPDNTAETIIEKVRWWSLLFAYAKSKNYFNNSQYFDSAPNWDVIV